MHVCTVIRKTKACEDDSAAACDVLMSNPQWQRKMLKLLVHSIIQGGKDFAEMCFATQNANHHGSS